jgi:DNA sulfur modification protein DndC
MILNDESKEWMQPLLDLRDELDFRSDESESKKEHRDFRRMSGDVQLLSAVQTMGQKWLKFCPYIKSWREEL